MEISFNRVKKLFTRSKNNGLYNWLLTTIAQSSAALVGISSGFLILRISLYVNEKIRQRAEYEKLYDGVVTNPDAIVDIPTNTTYYEAYRQEHNIYVEMKFPKKTYIGIIGIIWLMGFSIYYPVTLIPSDNLINQTTLIFVHHHF